MGVSGCGKSSVGERLARVLRIEFIEGDALHPPGNVARMAAGIALTDADRQGWLEALARHIAQAQADGRGLVVSCSALKRAYRDVLRGAAAPCFVMLHAPRSLLQARLAARVGHYMPASLLDSQLATLEAPDPDENAIDLDAGQPVESSVREVLARLRLTPAPEAPS